MFKVGAKVKEIVISIDAQNKFSLGNGVVVSCPEKFNMYEWANREDCIWVQWESYSSPKWCAASEIKLIEEK